MPPMASHLSPPDGSVTQEHLDRYVPRAAAGVGLVMVEHCYVVAGGRTSDDQLGIHDDALISGHARLRARIQATGAVTGIQLNHGGGKVPSACSGHQPVSASAGVVPRGQEECRAATVAEIQEYPRGFARAAPRRAGRLRSGRDPRRPRLPAQPVPVAAGQPPRRRLRR